MRALWSAKGVLILAFLAIIFVEGAGQTLADFQRGARPGALELFSRAPSQQNLRAFEARLEKDSWQGQWTRPLTQYLRYVVSGDLGAKALEGQEGWLFYRPGVDYLVQRWPVAGGLREPFEAVVAYRDALAARGIVLLVVIAPGKASIYPGKLGPRAASAPEAVRDHTKAFMEMLQGADVPLVDLFTLFSESRLTHEADEFYLARDTHWSPAGVKLAARAVADRIRAEGWIAPGETGYVERAVAVPREGDLLRMMDAPWIAEKFPGNPVKCFQIVDATTEVPYADESDSPVLLLGDSFLRIYQQDEPGSAGFIAHLARELQRPMASIVNDGGASTLVRQELSRNPALLQGKKLVVWEFVERDLRFGMEGWQHVALPAG